MTPAELLRLADRCEALTGPDRRLDAEIGCAVRHPHLRLAEPDDHKEFQRGVPPSPGHIWCPTGFLMAFNYTASLDAAMSLVPEGMEIELTDLYGVARVTVGLNINSGGEHGEHPGGNLVLALTAAALRVLARGNEGSE